MDAKLKEVEDKLRRIVGHGYLPFGSGQFPAQAITPTMDTLKFLLELTTEGVATQVGTSLGAARCP